jgi:hypothetical protein
LTRSEIEAFITHLTSNYLKNGMKDMNNPKEIETMTYTTNGLTLDEVGFIQIAGLKALSAAAKGELDLNRLAREELASRGLDKEGHWIGFERASQIHNVKK